MEKVLSRLSETCLCISFPICICGCEVESEKKTKCCVNVCESDMCRKIPGQGDKCTRATFPAEFLWCRSSKRNGSALFSFVSRFPLFFELSNPYFCAHPFSDGIVEKKKKLSKLWLDNVQKSLLLRKETGTNFVALKRHKLKRSHDDIHIRKEHASIIFE